MNPLFWIGVTVGIVVSIFSFFSLLSAFPETYSPFPTSVSSIFKDILGPVAAGFGGALLGAFATYGIQSHAERRKEKIAAINAYNKGVSILSMKYNDLWVLKHQLVTPHQDKELRFMHIPRTQGLFPNAENAADALNQIFIKEGMGDLLTKMLIAEKKYAAIHSSFQERNDMVQPFAKQLDTYLAKTRGRQSPTLGELVGIHSHTSLLRLYEYSEQLIMTLDDALLYLHTLSVRLVSELPMKIHFENNPIIMFKTEQPHTTPAPFYKDLNDLSAALEAAVAESKSKRRK
ncbi:hypothetical protein PseBG33_2876 [Pseudomonas synxantha BG33R]|uniref:hypothetical protein n=1 Tax=Pseudomonas synxantha TaxID=47883 RepID=UPI00025FDCAA|nr:hypothetical protein [Pseudomonas synxantha]EIK71860.1 hypothetical protein PseBG33_2876 [Pseudomonas synxantha BG33R]